MHEDEAAATAALEDRWRDEDGVVRCPDCGSTDHLFSTHGGTVTIYCGECPTSESAEFPDFKV
ncbi:transposase [Halobacteriaceae archaeon GCM10025711]